ncbi:MAG: CTP synthase [Aigarchaeota archaeon]|nr:CTP synthase [Aigarchaeota archaeon]MCX8192669.1 CTP synthase [Nitrososphaeria archaeon]MDW7985629.1 CTP synthase [Nitrososphaerota archaeon]
MKYVFVTGGVVSGLGKGVVTASIAKLFQFRKLNVDVIKMDPYLNVDPGTLNPIEHGEVYVCEDVWEFEPALGYRFRIAEVDQDFGTYERFLDKNMHPSNNITSGQVYLSVILKERIGEYLGKTIQVIPHITSEIKKRIRAVAQRSKPDVLLIEVGGTVGDIEAMPFLEAIRQLRLEEGIGNTALVHVTLIPFLETIGQFKTKPTQHSVKVLQSSGLQPDIIIGRTKSELTQDVREKIGLFCNVPVEAVISDPDLDVIYKLPLHFESQGLGDHLCRILQLDVRCNENALIEWQEIVNLYTSIRGEVTVLMPGKYTLIHDSYISINMALDHAGAFNRVKVRRIYLDTELYDKDSKKFYELLESADGILLTPGFGSRGVEGMVETARYALKNDKPFLGICFGCQLLFIAFAREVLRLKEASSTEIDPETQHPVVDLLPEQRVEKFLGGTMRIGSHPVRVLKDTILYNIYGSEIIHERFRHRYHINPKYVKLAEQNGLKASATDLGGEVVNAIEVVDKTWIIGVQFHPEFKSRPHKPSPIYYSFVRELVKRKSIEDSRR